MGKGNGGTRGSGAGRGDSSGGGADQVTDAKPREYGEYEDVQDMLDEMDLSDVDEDYLRETFTDELFDMRYNGEYWADDVAQYVAASGDCDEGTLYALGEMARQAPRTFDVLYRGLRFDTKAEAENFVRSVSGKNVTLENFTRQSSVVSFQTVKDSSFTYKLQGQTQCNVKLIGKTRGLDLSKAGENEVLVSSEQGVKVTKIYRDRNGNIDMTIKLK